MARNEHADSCDSVRERVLEQLSLVVDPCMEAAGLGLSLVDLGIVRSVNVDDNAIAIELGLTEPGCGFTHALVTKVEDALTSYADTRDVRVTFNWSEPWTEAMMSDAGRTTFREARERGAGLLRQLDRDGEYPKSA